MNKNILVLGEIYQDLHYESNFYEELVEKIADNVVIFLKYNPDDVNKKILEKLGVNMDTVFQIDEITPVNSIIKSNFASKILLSPNLQDKMSFEGIDIRDNVFDNAKIIFTTPLAKKFVKIFEN